MIFIRNRRSTRKQDFGNELDKIQADSEHENQELDYEEQQKTAAARVDNA